MASEWDEFEAAPAADPWGEFEIARPGDSPSRKLPPPAPPKRLSSQWLTQKLGEGFVPGFNRLAAGAGALVDVASPARGESQLFPPTLGERYGRRLEALRGESRAAQEQHPISSIGARIAGGAPLAMMTGGGGGLLQGLRSGAALGGAYAAGESEAPTLGGLAGDVVMGAGLGGALGGGLGALTPSVQAQNARLVMGQAGPLAPPGGGLLRRIAITQGRKALGGVGSPLSARRPIPEAAVEEALSSRAIRPLGTVTGTAERLRMAAEDLGSRYGDILAALEAKGVTGPNAVLLAQKLAREADAAAQVTLGSPRPGMLREAAGELAGKVDQSPFASKRLGLTQAEQIKRDLQFQAQQEYDKLARQYRPAGEAKKELASYMRGAIEDAVQQQAALAPEEAAAFGPVKAQLSRTLEALKHADESAARAARRSTLSLPGTIAGAAMGASHGPAAGIGSTLAHEILKPRLSSTLASGAYWGGRALGAAPVSLRDAVSQVSRIPAGQAAALLRAMRAHPELRIAPAAADQEQDR